MLLAWWLGSCKYVQIRDGVVPRAYPTSHQCVVKEENVISLSLDAQQHFSSWQMNLQLMVQEAPYPATEALQRISERSSFGSRQCIQHVSRCSSLGMFHDAYLSKTLDLTDLLLATRPVEESLAFPKIEWVEGIDDDSDNDIVGSSRRTSALTAGESSDSWASSSSSSSRPTPASSRGQRHNNDESQRRLVRSKSRHTRLSSLASFGSVTSNYSEAAISSCSSWGHFLSDEDLSTFYSFGSSFLGFDAPMISRNQCIQHVLQPLVEG